MGKTIRARVDEELGRRVGKWFTVREIQDKLKINPSTLKPLIMRYARENLLKRRAVKGTARSVEFTPASKSQTAFKQLLVKNMPYRNLSVPAKRVPAKRVPAKRAASPARRKKATTKRKASAKPVVRRSTGKKASANKRKTASSVKRGARSAARRR